MKTDHWREYAIEATLLGLFMVSACGFTVLLFHPTSPVTSAIPDPTLRRFLIGLAMGGTAITLIYSPWGMRSGAHFNPAVTLTFTRLGRMAPRDAAGYVAAQFIGGVIGVLLAALALGDSLANSAVHYAVTRPGAYGVGAAFLAETAISFLLMTMVLEVSNRPRVARFTGIGAGLLVATFITLEAPLSGMSMNPRAHGGLRGVGRRLDRDLDLLPGSGRWNVRRCGAVRSPPGSRGSLLRQDGA